MTRELSRVGAGVQGSGRPTGEAAAEQGVRPTGVADAYVEASTRGPVSAVLPWFCVSVLALVVITRFGHAEIIDQVAATVDDQIITSSQIMDEIRGTAFLNVEKPDFSGAARRQTAERLVERLLVEREMQLTHYPQPQATEVANALNEIKARFEPGGYEKALKEYRITEAQLIDVLLRQAALLRYIDLRFRPEVQVSEKEISSYYDNVYLPEIRKKGVSPEPTLEDARDEIEETLAAQLVDKRVDQWLKEARSRSRILFEEDAFQ